MNYTQDDPDTERPSTGGSVKRARERALAGLPREPGPPPIAPAPPPPASRIPRFTPGPREGSSAIPIISRPTQVPQWPLAGPSIPPIPKPIYQPPAGRGPAPQRPPRPAHVPSMLDASKVQDHIPVFQYTPQSGRESELSANQSRTSTTSQTSSVDSVASIPDFPLPVTGVTGPPRRSVTLGPPPSARRGASSFYSNASFVSPIPEESPRARSHTSYASSAAIPRESWASTSPGPSPTEYQDGRYEDTLQVGGRGAFGEGDESQLVRSASVGKRGKALLVSTPAPQRSSEIPEINLRPSPSPRQFEQESGFGDSSSSSSLPKGSGFGAGAALTPDAVLDAYGVASSSDPSNQSSRRMSVSPPMPPTYSRLSAIRRPPRIDVDGIKAAESRGSLTSLPELIRRATRLAASLEKGRRPASRFNSFEDDYQQDYARDSEKDLSDFEKHQSGLSDMLAAFPPPVQQQAGPARRSFRQSVRDGLVSWPLPATRNSSRSPPRELTPSNDDASFSNMNIAQNEKGIERKGRRCCGLPLWGFVILVIIVILIVTAAVVVPVEFFVVRRSGGGSAQPAQTAIGQCQSQLTCANGGINIITAQGTCSCLCTNGFTGQTCTQLLTQSCTTTNIVDQNPNVGSNRINNATLGDAMPRLIQNAQASFGIPLSVSQILAKFNTANLSCTAENALVTFNGQSAPSGGSAPAVSNFNSGENPGVKVEVVTVIVKRQNGFTTILPVQGTVSIPLSSAPATTTTTTTTTTTIRSTSRASTTTAAQATPSAVSFTVTDDVLDFGRVAVLFVLQQDSLGNAEQAQGALQRFFTAATTGRSTGGNQVPVTPDQARNVTILNGNSVNLIDFTIDVGAGPQGRRGGATSAAVVVRDLSGGSRLSLEQRTPPR